MKIGIHQRFDGLYQAAWDAQQIGANTCQVFIRNNRNNKQRSFTQFDFNYYNANITGDSFNDLVVHACYTINPATCDPYLMGRTKQIIREDLAILNSLVGDKYYVLHPGSAVGCTTEHALDILQRTLHELASDMGSTMVCVETMAGAGNQLLSTIPQIHTVLSACQDIPQFALTVDTCHIWGAGIESQYLVKYLSNFDKKYLGVIHVNGSLEGFNSHKDRHANIENGVIPIEELVDTVYNLYKVNEDAPIILETPAEKQLHDMQLLRTMLTSKNCT